MKKYIFLIVSLFAFAGITKAETYGNEWINPDLKYYKFKVINTGIHRIPSGTLLAHGIPSGDIIGENVHLYRNGQEVPVYLTTDGQFGENDFIEFYGEMNDGLLDRKLYLVPEYQPNVYASLFNDTAVYYLTFHPGGNGLRMQSVQNLLQNLPVKEEYFIQKGRLSLMQLHNVGENPNQLLNYVFDSEFDVGEGFSGAAIAGPSGVRTHSVLTRNRYLGNAAVTAKISGVISYRNNSTAHRVALQFGSQILDTLNSNRAGIVRFKYDLPVTALGTGSSTFRIAALINNERIALNWFEYEYPRLFNLSNDSKTTLAIRKKENCYIEIASFSDKGTDGIVYDLKNQQRYLTIKEENLHKIHFVATPIDKDSLYLSSQDPADIITISAIEDVFHTQIEEADYVIITMKGLRNSSDGINYIDEYAKYRASAAGGNYRVKVYYIDELENSFSYGVKGHPLAIRSAVNYLIDRQSVRPEYLFIIGKGLSYSTHRNATTEMVQTYGHPASDNLLVARSSQIPYPQVGVGRLSAKTSDDIRVYLDKIKLYEEVQKTGGVEEQTLEKKEWMKSVLHMGGGNFVDEQQTFARYLENYRRIIEGPSFGGKVHSVYKNSTDPVQIAQSAIIDSMLFNGTSLITFFGHSSTSTVDFDLEPESFKNPRGKYPFMFTNGCFVGNIFENYNSYSERFVLTPDRCAIGYLAPMTYAVAYSLNQYANNFYNRLGVVNYAQPVGVILKNTATDVLSSTLQTDRFLGQQMIYHGDPAIKLNSFEKPDYIITEKSISFVPEVVNASVDTFQILINHKNIGRAINASYKVLLERRLPNGEVETYEEVVDAPHYSDSVYISIPTNNISGLGQNTFHIKIDADDEIDELSELNNEVTLTRYFTIDDLIPIVPGEFSIVNKPNLKLQYSTANPLIETRRYIVQIDTTEFFNSPVLVSQTLTESGGIVDWQPGISLLNNTVYYWRGSLDTLYGNNLSWNKSSFLYNTNLSEGWNQSHYFQFKPDIYNNMYLKDDRTFSFIDNVRAIKVINGVDAVGANDRVLFADNSLIARNAFARSGFLFYVLDTRTGLPMSTYQIGNTGYGEYGNVIATLLTDVKIIEFNTTTQRGRYSCYNFLKNVVPDQAIVCGYSFQNAQLSQWANDDSSAYNGETLFDAFESIGVTNIRSVQDLQPFVFFTQKGNPFFETQQILVSRSEKIEVEFTYTGSWNNGNVLSPLIGPALKWNTIDHNWKSLEQPVTDKVTYNLYGYSKNGVREKLYDAVPKNADITFVNSDEYPFLQLEYVAEDVTNSTAPQLDYWRIIYEEVPEGAMNPQKHLVKSNDTIPYGSKFRAEIAFENITDIAMDSILVKFTVKDATNQVKTSYKRFAPLPGRSHIVIDFEHAFDNVSYQGVNTITFEANPNKDQKERHHFNNFAFFTVVLEKDNLNPVMDVTFDGRHITDGEIISPKPEILIRLKDENQHLALNDTTLFKLFLKTPNSTTPIPLDPRAGDFSFIPADEGKLATNNEAKLFFRPTFMEDGMYELRVQGADRSMNDAGSNEYRIQFQIDTRPAISNIINYPNPFSTSTQFIFTVTGTEVPTDLKIQIMTVTGKVVKEITAQELGYIHIGQNRTEYKWDGTDTYGDRLANGLYLYRVTARLNGKNMDLIEGSVDKYFKKGFGKMYIVR